VPFKGLFAIFLALTLTNTANAGPAENVDEKGLSTKSSRDKRLLSLFAVVQFKNNECTATSGLDGVCYSSTDCSDAGGTASGNCAAGFGVCCIIEIAACGGTVTKNATYVSNADYPSTITSSALSCTYTVNYCSTNICQLRLDFTNLVLSSSSGAVTSNYVYVNGPTDVDPPYISGTNTGYHMYVETAKSTTTTPILVTTASTTTAQSWRIKVSQIECDSLMLAPEGCTQYFTTDSGTIYSYGYGTPIELQSQKASYCVRGNALKCAIDYSAAGGTSPDTFEIAATGTASETTACTTSTIHINNINVGTEHKGTGYICGDIFSHLDADATDGTITQAGPPFFISHISKTSAITTVGFKLNYIQHGNCS